MWIGDCSMSEARLGASLTTRYAFGHLAMAAVRRSLALFAAEALPTLPARPRP